jgi:hypothetical protein
VDLSVDLSVEVDDTLDLALGANPCSLLGLLRFCDWGDDQDEEYREAVRRAGVVLRGDEERRKTLRQTRIHGVSTEEWLRKSIAEMRPRDAGPWWDVWDYAFGRPVSAEAEAFFSAQ